MPRSRRTRSRTLKIGSISSGTLRPEDIIPELLWDLRRIKLSRADRTAVRKLEREFDAAKAEDSECPECDDVLGDLYTLAESYTPDYCYLGSTDGDGAEIGVWPSGELLDGRDDGEVFRSDKTPGEYRSAFYNGHANGIEYSSGQRQDMKARWYGDIAKRSHWLYVNDHGNATLYRRAGKRWIEVWSVV